MLALVIIFLLIVGFVYGAGTDNIDRRTVRSFDLDRYMGDWYEIARFDHPFERGLAEVRSSYRLLGNGRIGVENRGVRLRDEKRRCIRGKGRTTSVPGRLRISFLRFFYDDYNVMELGDDYDWALVGSGSAKRLWILSRTPRLSVRTLNRILRLAEQRGYRTERLIYVDHASDGASECPLPPVRVKREEPVH